MGLEDITAEAREVEFDWLRSPDPQLQDTALQHLSDEIPPIGNARLADLSLVTIISDQSTPTSSSIEDGTTQWMNPELLGPETFGLKICHPTKESDAVRSGW
jgi:hypothetical protein